MEILPDFTLLRPMTIQGAIDAGLQNPKSRWLAGGTDLLVNLRRGVGDPPEALIDLRAIDELNAIVVSDKELTIGAAVTLTDLAKHPDVIERYPCVAQAAASVAGPTHQRMGTIGGNLCLDTRCMYYNQSEWWRGANDHCLKYGGTVCHVAPKSKDCFATFSGDLAPALMVLGATAELIGPDGLRVVPLADLYTGDGQAYLNLKPGEILTTITVNAEPDRASGYEKMRVRRSIDFPLAGVAVALIRSGDVLSQLQIAITGTNPRPVLLEGTDDLCVRPLDAAFAERLDHLVRDQIMSMKTTFTPGHYRRKIAGVLAQRLTETLYQACA
jgi:4-hydroxybenzoyl-CoA reductase subunit beta